MTGRRGLLLQTILVALGAFVIASGLDAGAGNSVLIVVGATFLAGFRAWVLDRYTPTQPVIFARMLVGEHMTPLVRAFRSDAGLLADWRHRVDGLDQFVDAPAADLEAAARILREIKPPVAHKPVPVLVLAGDLILFLLGLLLSTWLPSIDALAGPFASLCDTSGVLRALSSPVHLLSRGLYLAVGVVLVLRLLAWWWNRQRLLQAHEMFERHTGRLLRIWLQPRALAYADALGSDLRIAGSLLGVSPSAARSIIDAVAATSLDPGENVSGWRSRQLSTTNGLVLPQLYFVLGAWLGISLPALLHMGACGTGAS